MIFLPRVLSVEQLAFLRQSLSAAQFSDGKATSGGAAAAVKQNSQLHRTGSPQEAAMDQTVMNALNVHELFSAAVLPKKYAMPLYSRYEPGMHYGAHVDSAFMGADSEFRSDISVTIFLNEPGEYEGGELAIEQPDGVRNIKLSAGDAVAYPTFDVHQVNPVTSGHRLVAVTWAQSQVRDSRVRDVLFDLQKLGRTLAADPSGGQNFLLAQKSFVNLLRIFGE